MRPSLSPGREKSRSVGSRQPPDTARGRHAAAATALPRADASGGPGGGAGSAEAAGRKAGGVRTRAPEAVLVLAFTAVVGTACFWAHGTPFAVAVATLLMLVTPGLGANCVVDFPDGVGRLPTILLASLAWCTCVGLVMAYAQFTSSAGIFAVLALPGVIGALLLLARGQRAGDGSSSRDAGRHRSDRRSGRHAAVHVDGPSVDGWGPSPMDHRGRRRLQRGHRQAVVAALTGGSLLAWGYAVQAGRHDSVGAYGLLPVLGYPFVIAVLLAAGTVLVGLLLSPRSPGAAVIGLLTIGVEFTVTPALFTSHFLGGWNYKHVGVVDLISSGQALDGGTDLFQAWPGFFATAANLVSVAGGSPISYANWATPVFWAVGAVALYSATRTLYREPAIAILAVLVYLTTGWASQMYYSPQTLAFTMSMLVLTVVVPVLLDTGAMHARDRFRRAVVLWGSRDLAGAPPGRPPGPGTALIAALGGIAFVCIVATHQLTPYMLLLQFAPFVALSWVGRRWQLGYLLMALVALGYLLLHSGALGTESLFSGFSFRNAAGIPPGWTSEAQQLARGVSRAIAFCVWGGAVVAALSYRRRFGQVAVPVVFAFMPLTLVLFQSYGGEAIYRVWLFSAPWCAVIIAKRLYDLKRRRITAVLALGVFTFTAFFGSAQATTFGMFPMVELTSGEISASSWFYEHAPPGTRLVLVMASFPQRLDRHYVDHDGDVPSVNEPALADDPQFAGGGLDGMTAADLASHFQGEWGRNSYLAISRSMEGMNDYYGVFDAGTLERLDDRLSSSPDWTVAYRDRDAVIFRLG